MNDRYPFFGSVPTETFIRKEHITLTVIVYNAVQGGIPSEDDVRAVIDDMENLFESC